MLLGRQGSRSCGYFNAKMRGSRRTAKSDRSKPALVLFACCDEGRRLDRITWWIEFHYEMNRRQVRRCVISLQTILEHYGRFSDFVVQKCTKAQPLARCMVEGAALLLSDLGVTRAVLSAAWFPGELAKPRSATARSVSPYAPVFPSWDWASRPFIHVRRLCLWNTPVRMRDM